MSLCKSPTQQRAPRESASALGNGWLASAGRLIALHTTDTSPTIPIYQLVPTEARGKYAAQRRLKCPTRSNKMNRNFHPNCGSKSRRSRSWACSFHRPAHQRRRAMHRQLPPTPPRPYPWPSATQLLPLPKRPPPLPPPSRRFPPPPQPPRQKPAICCWTDCSPKVVSLRASPSNWRAR